MRNVIGFDNPKHIKQIRKYAETYLGFDLDYDIVQVENILYKGISTTTTGMCDYNRKVITIKHGACDGTLYHEIFHAYLNTMPVDSKRYQALASLPSRFGKNAWVYEYVAMYWGSDYARQHECSDEVLCDVFAAIMTGTYQKNVHAYMIPMFVGIYRNLPAHIQA
jgi:hypothetical protein